MLERKTVENDIYNLSKAFAIRIVNLYKFLVNERHEYVMSKQLFRSGKQYESISGDCFKIIAVLTKIVKATKC